MREAQGSGLFFSQNERPEQTSFSGPSSPCESPRQGPRAIYQGVRKRKELASCVILLVSGKQKIPQRLWLGS